MRIEEIYLRHFRNYEQAQIRFQGDVVFFTGPNASGKTNLLEALSYLSVGKSFRGASDKELIYHDSDEGAYFACQFEKKGSLFKLEISIPKKGSRYTKKIKLNGKNLSGRAELIGKILTVVISPSDLSIVEGGPVFRRKFMDLILSYENKEYLSALMRYTRALKQRNAILKNAKQKKQGSADLGYWDKEFIPLAMYLIENRNYFIEKFSLLLRDILSEISGGKDQIHLEMGLLHPDETSDFGKTLHGFLERDLYKGYTGLGPHRHTVDFLLNGNPIENYGSQGQKRSLVLALRIAQFYYLKQALGETPILLIDDVIRELDKNRRNAFVKLIEDCGQAFFTTPDMDGLDVLQKNVHYEIFHLKEPAVLEKQGQG